MLGILLLFHRLVVSNPFATPWTVAHQAPLSIGFPRQEFWSGLPFPSPGDLPDPGIKPASPAWQAGSLPLSHLGRLHRNYYLIHEASLVAQAVKNVPAKQEMQVWSLGREDPLEKEMATHSRILAWEIQWTKEPGGLLRSMGSQKSWTQQSD